MFKLNIASDIIKTPYNISQNPFGGSIGSFNSIIVTLLALVLSAAPLFLSMISVLIKL